MTPRRVLPLPCLIVLLAGCATAPDQPAGAGHAGESMAAQSPVQAFALPAGAADAEARLLASPRHGEWAVIRSGRDSIRAWVVYPERATRAPVVLVVHEIFGLSHWVRAVADQLAADGFLAIAPDLLTMKDIPAGPDGAPAPEHARREIATLAPADVHRYLRAVAAWGMALPAAAPRYGIVGYCWGGTVSFTHAIESAALGAAVVYYGSSPDTARLASIRAPVLGLYAGDDARVNATVPDARTTMERHGRTFNVHFFAGSGHGFLRQQDGRDGANYAATRAAWPLTVAWFRQHLER